MATIQNPNAQGQPTQKPKATPQGLFAQDVLGLYKQAVKGMGSETALGVMKEVTFRLAMVQGNPKQIMEPSQEDVELVNENFQTALGLASDDDDPFTG